ncbi:LytR/AlgR family response regulator transcription factor [candidate division KSB1 bacterium]
MIVVIVEDEHLIASRIERMIKEILKKKLTKIIKKDSLHDAMDYIFKYPVDLLLLDLNLSGRDGFELLKQAVSGSFHTIIISAYTDRAIEAFEYGVLDFIGKPFTKERLQKAVSRLENVEEKNLYPTKYAAVRKSGKLLLIEVNKIVYIRGAGNYAELILKNGSVEIHDKPLIRLQSVLPTNFIRTHKSYIVNIQSIKSFASLGGSKYTLELTNGEILPVSRKKHKEIKEILSR